jgi:mRNA interferase YafQ
MLTIEYTKKMKTGVKLMKKRGKDISKLTAALDLLASQKTMPERYYDHPLKGDMIGYRECHIEPNWLLIYRVYEDKLLLLASGTGTHSDLFRQ